MRKIVLILLVLFVSYMSSNLWATPVPETGQTTCYNVAGTIITCPDPGQPLAQDGSYNIYPMSYTDNGDGTITDNVTGLIWQKQDNGYTYNWYQAAGVYHATYNNNSTDVCGSLGTGWRLPAEKELMSIVKYGTYNPSIDTSKFTNTKYSDYWTSTTYAPQSTWAWFVNFGKGVVNYYNGKSNHYLYVRCVKGDQNPGPSLNDNEDGTVTDNTTGLMWQQGEGGSKTWADAIAYCEDLPLANHDDWRLPNVKELESLADTTMANPSIDKANFFPSAYSATYWSSTTNARWTNYPWYVVFSTGYTYTENKTKTTNALTRCVRNAPYTLSVVRSPETVGGVASSLDGDDYTCGINGGICCGNLSGYCYSDCQESYLLGSQVILKAFPDDGWAFAGWETPTGSSTSNPIALTVNAATTVTAFFKPKFTFPLNGYTPTSVPISSVLDHSVFDITPVKFYETDNIVKAFNGEIGDSQYGYKITDGVRGYKQESGGDFLPGYTYPDPDNEYLFYDGHPGYDFAVAGGTDVLAPFSGMLYWATSDPVNGTPGDFGTFYIDHGNGYSTWFLHCSGLVPAVAAEVQQNGFAQVTKGDHVAESGAKGANGRYHLHFEVRKDGVDDANIVDPYKEDLWE